jgi:hypothetical protein
MPRRPPSDALRSELDKLALKLVREASLAGNNVRDRTNALKVASGWYGISRKGQKPDDGATNAWDTYRESQTTNGEDEDATAD